METYLVIATMCSPHFEAARNGTGDNVIPARVASIRCTKSPARLNEHPEIISIWCLSNKP